MDIIFHGQHNAKQAGEHLVSMLQLFQERYRIKGFREMHLSVTLLDAQGADVELVDSDTDQALRMFEVYQHDPVLKRKKRPELRLLVNKEME